MYYDGLQGYQENIENQQKNRPDKGQEIRNVVDNNNYEEMQARQIQRQVELMMQEGVIEDQWKKEIEEMRKQMKEIKEELEQGERNITRKCDDDEQVEINIYKKEEKTEEKKKEKRYEIIMKTEILKQDYVIVQPQVLVQEEVLIQPEIIVQEEVIVQPQVLLQEEVIVQPQVLVQEEVLIQPEIIVQEEVIVQPQVLLQEDVLIHSSNIPSSNISTFQVYQSHQAIHLNQLRYPIHNFQTYFQQQYLLNKQEQYLQQATINALSSPILLGQQSFPPPQQPFYVEQVPYIDQQYQIEKYERMQILRREQQLQTHRQFPQMQQQRQIQREQTQILRQQLKQEQQQQKVNNISNNWNKPLQIQREFTLRDQLIFEKPVKRQQFIEINTQQYDIKAQVEYQPIIQRQNRTSYQKAQLAKQQAQIFKPIDAQEEYKVYSQPHSAQKFTIENAIAFKDPSILLGSPIFYNEFFEWKEGMGELTNVQLRLPDKTLRVNDIQKIKILKDVVIHNSRKIKLNFWTQVKLFAVQPKLKFQNFPLHYYWFAKIITEKLKVSKGYDLNKPFIPKKDYTNVNVKNRFIDGILYKKSQYIGKWQLRYIAITQAGLFSFKDQKGGQTFSIKKDTTTELWTRFDIYDRMLVIKVHHNNRKTQFGIPIVDYCEQSQYNWLFAFYHLIYSR